MMAKAYLQCRMDQYVLPDTRMQPDMSLYDTLMNRLTSLRSSNLMAPDELKNLGFAEDEKAVPIPRHAGGPTSNKTRDDGKKIY